MKSWASWQSWSTCLVVALAASQLGATDCGGNVTRDPGFDLWCGEILCTWKIERGDIRRVPTWHTGDSGVELLDSNTAIEQFTPVDSGDGRCLRFDLIADAAEDAQAELGVDIYGDGSLERVFPIPSAHWKPLSYEFAVTPPFTGIRFEIAKRGPGRAVVARMHAFVVKDGCQGLPRLTGGPAPLGALCSVNTDCASAICTSFDVALPLRCAGCNPLRAADCTDGLVCGYGTPGPPERAVPLACVGAGVRLLGEQCLRDPECATGICALHVCSTCRSDADCGGSVCGGAFAVGPQLCAPGQHSAPRGAPCASNDDCASGACNGPPRQQCLDGRACATDANCPVEAGLIPGPCLTVGVQGGSCN